MEHFLDRTVQLIREELSVDIAEPEITASLRDFCVTLVSDEATASTRAGQTAIVTAAILLARCGFAIALDIPNVKLNAAQPPLRGTHLRTALNTMATETDGLLLISSTPHTAPDVVILFGDTAAASALAKRSIRVTWSEWGAKLGPPLRAAKDPAIPVGALAAGALSASETFKTWILRLSGRARAPQLFREMFAAADDYAVQLAPDETAAATDLGGLDIISGGAVCNAFLYGLLRIPDVAASVRIIEPQEYDVTNHNRCVMMSANSPGRHKAEDLAQFSTAAISIKPILDTVQGALESTTVAPLAPVVVVGVDDIPTRWYVQEHAPHWVGVGATSHWSAMASFHLPGAPCARCLHPHNDGDAGVAPTISFVSFWAGLLTLSYLLRYTADRKIDAEQAYVTPTGLNNAGSYWVTPVVAHSACPRHFRYHGGAIR